LDIISIKVSPTISDAQEQEIQKQVKLVKYDSELTAVLPFLYNGSKTVARNLKLLTEKGITHIINCSANIYPNYFPDKFKYMSLCITDEGQEDIISLFPFVISAIEKIRTESAVGKTLSPLNVDSIGLEDIDSSKDSSNLMLNKSKILVHCHLGVSRSTSMVIAYLMWAFLITPDLAIRILRKRRGIVRPNYGFVCQLHEWGNRLKGSINYSYLNSLNFNKSPELVNFSLPNDNLFITHPVISSPLSTSSTSIGEVKSSVVLNSLSLSDSLPANYSGILNTIYPPILLRMSGQHSVIIPIVDPEGFSGFSDSNENSELKKEIYSKFGCNRETVVVPHGVLFPWKIDSFDSRLCYILLERKFIAVWLGKKASSILIQRTRAFACDYSKLFYCSFSFFSSSSISYSNSFSHHQFLSPATTSQHSDSSVNSNNPSNQLFLWMNNNLRISKESDFFNDQEFSPGLGTPSTQLPLNLCSKVNSIEDLENSFSFQLNITNPSPLALLSPPVSNYDFPSPTSNNLFFSGTP
jgi:hypothetical protein